VREPPAHPTADVVVATVRRHWNSDAENATYLALGFGAHRWRVVGPAVENLPHGETGRSLLTPQIVVGRLVDGPLPPTGGGGPAGCVGADPR
jgi:hypothetical protein